MTERGLRVGDSLDRVRELYPELERFTDLYGDARGLPLRVGARARAVAGRRAAEPDRPAEAEIRKRKVVSLTVSPYGAGD